MEINNSLFFIDDNRAMVSLGPLTKNKYCPYSCAFCYVKSGFVKYPNLEIDEIISWLIENKNKYNIVYISGDTDSFAPPRTNEAIKLLEEISKNIDVDITFTTRTLFTDNDIYKLKTISDNMKARNHKLIASISISRLSSASFIEPLPIPSPEKRIELLKKLKDNGLYTMLAVRPFLPIISSDEYLEIIKKCKDFADVVLGEVWYASDDLIEAVCKDVDVNKIPFVDKKMDFDKGNKTWKCFEAKEIIDTISKYCSENDIKFYMRSYPAIEYIRNHYK